MTSHHPALRLTPSNSPFFKSPTPRSPIKNGRQEEPGLRLRKVIGTTTASATGFSAAAGRFAVTAGAAAVVATVDKDLNITQHFFRANPSSAYGARDLHSARPGTPTPNEPRHRTVGHLKDPNTNSSPSNSTTRDWADSPGKTTSARDRVKAASSVSLSPNGKWLAVGETGYRPRILVFSLKDGSSETPVSIVVEHTFGVHALSFSPDSKSLASLGTVNDGFIYVWNIDDRTGTATLSASNKCTTLVHDMAWMGRCIVTVGLRFVKVWRPDEYGDSRVSEAPRAFTLTTPRHKENRLSDFGNSILTPRHRTLAGKNCLLGDLLEGIFTSVMGYSDSKAVICAETGEIALLDDSEKMQSLTLAANAGIRITAARLDTNGMLHAAGSDGDVASFLLADLKRLAATTAKIRRQSESPAKTSQPGAITTTAFAAVGDALVEVDSNRVIRISAATSDMKSSHTRATRQMTAHEGAVLGVQAVCSTAHPAAAFLSFSSDGKVHFWNDHGVSIVDGLAVSVQDSPEMYGLQNELKAVAMLSGGAVLVSGDRYGTLVLTDLATRRVLHRIRGHSAEVLDLLSFERGGSQYLVSASRDRTVQLFCCRGGKLELLQTMDEHAGAVTGLLLSCDGENLMSCSADRSIVVRECIFRSPEDPTTLAFAMVRAITLKSSPSSMCLTAQEDMILVSTVGDRCISKHSIRNGQSGFSFKCSDNDGGDAVVMSKILYAPSLNGNPTIAGVSSSDKSVRLYSEYGSLMARDWGHTEGITDAAFVPAPSMGRNSPSFTPQLVTVAADSTIFLWDNAVSRAGIAGKAEASIDGADAKATTNAPLLHPPLRKVISYSEMSRFRNRPAEEVDSPSPPAAGAASQPSSPQKLRKKTSRTSLAQAPRLEPMFRSNFESSRRRSVFQRSPSPPSPRHTGRKDRKPSLGMSLRSESSENILNTGGSTSGHATGFGSLTASTESVCRTLRAYRKKLASSSSSERITPDALKELERELKLTARAVGEKSHGKSLDEATMARLLDQASDRIVGLLNSKIKAHVEDEFRRNGDRSPSPSAHAEHQLEHIQEHVERSDTSPGAWESPNLDRP
ncbi:Mitogen-activated kinase-binding 1 [Lecanosticta acicola]|uniref:Mitogen-activated kinase-binding 1 n=1 Tax=Lecanosticta acicola TaxID=111012 RepID=A0AAI8Z8M5_9PEZI|nr:Mitogen-activated kinase-binding 1 [Lecanosticta acicola]